MRFKERDGIVVVVDKFLDVRFRFKIGLCRRKLVGVIILEFGVLGVELEISD